jgi:hypothetical protein
MLPSRSDVQWVVRRAPAISLLLAISFTLIAPLLASSQPDSDLPACCRRDGKHHCSMMDADESAVVPSGATFNRAPTRCQQFPSGKPAPVVVPRADIFTLTAVPVTVAYQSSAVAEQRTANPSLAFPASCPKRGPPSIL